MDLNVYKTNEFVDTYSKNGAYDDPISPKPDIRYDGVVEDSKDFRLYLRNDGTVTFSGIVVTPVDLAVPPTETGWMSLATTLAGLSTAIPGAALNLANLVTESYQVFWLRITVPADTTFTLKQDLALRITAIQGT